MSPAGFSGSTSTAWRVYTVGRIDDGNVTGTIRLRAVLNLTSDTKISDGDGTKENPFVVE